MYVGAYLLAKADLLDGYQASMHWENTLAAQEEFPQVHLIHIFSPLIANRVTPVQVELQQLIFFTATCRNTLPECG